MISELKFIPVTETSKPFAAAAETCSFHEIGYIEDEYFMTGTASVYSEDEKHKVSPIFESAPYTTRLLVRRPSDVKKFSGNVVIEILNASAMIDIDRMWVNSWQFFTRNGDIFIGISSKGHVVDSMKRFDPERYAPINWANPMPDRKQPESGSQIFQFLPQFESGLFWDMMVELAKLLRSDSSMNPIAVYGKSWLYLTGWSQSTGYVNRIVRSFAYLPENCADGPLFDGYLNGGGGAGLAPINAYAPMTMFRRESIPQSGVFGAKEPYIAINTESENRSQFWYGDFDEPKFKLRTWQIAGSSHDSKYNLIDYYGEENLAMLDRIGIHNAYYGVDGDPLDAPYEVVFNAAYYALYQWARNRIPAPHAPKIETVIGDGPSGDPFGSFVGNLTDALGNCLGGIRTPAINYPTGKYTSFSVGADGRVWGMFGKVNPFSPEMLKALYGNIDNYRVLIDADCDRLIAKGFMLADDKPAFIDRVIGDARKRGL